MHVLIPKTSEGAGDIYAKYSFDLQDLHLKWIGLHVLVEFDN